MNIVNDNQRVMKTLDDSWNNQDWHTFNKRHIENVAVDGSSVTQSGSTEES